MSGAGARVRTGPVVSGGPVTIGSMNEIKPNTLADDAVVLDVREPSEFSAGHAENAIHIPLGTLPARVNELPTVEGPLPIICRSGGRSGQATAWLEAQGIAAVNVDGGMLAWQNAGKKMVAEEGDPSVL